MSYGRMARRSGGCGGRLKARLAAAGAADAAEDARLGRPAGRRVAGGVAPPGDRLAAIRAAKSRWRSSSGQRTTPRAAAGPRPEPEGRAALQAVVWRAGREGAEQLHGPESGDHEDEQRRFQQCYNAQVAVDGAHQLVVATEVTANASDQGGVPALLDALAETVGEQPETVLADARLQQRAGLGGPGNARHRTGMCPWAGRGRRPGPRDPEKYPATSPHGREAVEAGGPCGVCRTQVAVGGSQRLDQARAGIPTLQPAGAGEGAGRVGTWCAWR